jgi:hypothetical protein
VLIHKWWFLFQAKAAAIFKPEAQRRYVEDLKIERTPA